MADIPPKDRVLGNLLRRTVERHPDRIFFQFRDVELTYGAFNGIANRTANGLTGLGLPREGKLAIMTPNCPEFLYAWLGGAKTGAVYVPINTDYRGDILRYQLNKADATHMVIDAQYLEQLDAVIENLPQLKHVIVRGGADAPERVRARTTVTAFDALLQAPDDEPDVALSYTDPLAISFTSGTTGPSKGVYASNCHVVTFALDWIRANDFRDGDSIYSPLPLFHAIASWLGIVPTIIQGGRMAMVERFSASAFWDDVRRYDVSLVHGIFSMIPILLKQPPRPEDATQPARTFYIGQQNEAFEKRFNCRIVEVFGSTETGIVTMTPYHAERRKGSCGKVNTETFDVMIANDADEPVKPGEVGEILVRPRQPFSMLREYYNMPQESLAAFQNLWFHTGDNARIDEDGYITFVDRKKDAIRRRGENISSFEVESVVNRHPAVLECAAVAVSSELGEDDVKVVVVLQEGQALTAGELWAFCEEHMPRFWIPRYIEFRPQLPKTPNQKIQKYLLRDGPDAGEIHDRGALAGSARAATAKALS